MTRPSGHPRVCSVPGCGRRHAGHGYCSTHLARRTAHGDVRADVPVGARTAADSLSYGKVHQQLRTERGPATGHPCADCSEPARYWSYDGADRHERRDPRGVFYSLDLDHYRPRCASCLRAATQPGARPGCQVPGCDGEHDAHGYCHTHLSRVQRLGDARPEVPIQHKHTHGKTSYWSVHERLRAERGASSAQTCADCDRPGWCWSYDGADPDERTDSSTGYRYSLDLARYRPRCRGCHRRATIARAAPRPRVSLPDIEGAVWLYERGVSASAIGALQGVSRTAVFNALRAQGVTIRARGSYRPLGDADRDGQAS